jgi:hypothetical protein
MAHRSAIVNLVLIEQAAAEFAFILAIPIPIPKRAADTDAEVDQCARTKDIILLLLLLLPLLARTLRTLTDHGTLPAE